MGSNKSKHITDSNIDKWMSSLGFSFPRNLVEDELFDKLYKNYEHELTGEEIDPFTLIRECEEEEKISSNSGTDWKMAARNYGNLPKHIIDKMKKNHNGKK